MNQIYKVIWSKVKHCCIVVSELAKRDGKVISTRSRRGKQLAASLAVMALCAGIVPGVMAADDGSDTGWKLGVDRSVYSTTTENEATATGKTALITDGTTVNLLAGRGIKLTQYGTSIRHWP